MSRSTFDKMGLTSNMLKPSHNPLYGFAGDKFVPDGNIDLPLSAGGPDNQKALIVKFLVVNIPLVYNIILGHPTLNGLKAIIFTYHLLMKFPVGDDVGEVREDQYKAKRFYALALRERSSNAAEVHTIIQGPPCPDTSDLVSPDEDNPTYPNHPDGPDEPHSSRLEGHNPSPKEVFAGNQGEQGSDQLEDGLAQLDQVAPQPSEGSFQGQDPTKRGSTSPDTLD